MRVPVKLEVVSYDEPTELGVPTSTTISIRPQPRREPRLLPAKKKKKKAV